MLVLVYHFILIMHLCSQIINIPAVPGNVHLVPEGEKRTVSPINKAHAVPLLSVHAVPPELFAWTLTYSSLSPPPRLRFEHDSLSVLFLCCFFFVFLAPAASDTGIWPARHSSAQAPHHESIYF